MSDFDDDMDDGELSIEYSSEDNSEPDVDLENQYYVAKSLKEANPLTAIEEFKKVLQIESQGEQRGEWGFKALKQIIKINFKLNNSEEMMHNYVQLLTYIRSAVTRNYSEKSINSILDYVSTSNQMEMLQKFYTTTLDALKEAKNERLWFKTNIKLGKLYLELNQWSPLLKIIKELRQSCQTNEGEDDLRKGTQLLEIYALEIQMYTIQRNNKKLKNLYEQSLYIKSAIPHPLIMGIIRECGGKMHLRQGEFEKAHTDFFEAFKNYDESGSQRRTQCLKYLVLSNMLTKSAINPFDSQEIKPYRDNPEIVAMTNLVWAYQNNDVVAFEATLHDNADAVMKDAFIREHVEELLRNIRIGVLKGLVRPYNRVKLSSLAEKLRVSQDEVEALLVACIADGAISNGYIDQAEGVLEIGPGSDECSSKYKSLDKLIGEIDKLSHDLVMRVVDHSF